jgi:pyrroline-5-carboxylate reductase
LKYLNTILLDDLIMVSAEKVGIIGSGKMGEALISGILKSSEYSSQNVLSYDKILERRKYIKSTYGIRVLKSISEVVNKSSIIAIAVKPQDIIDVLKQVGENDLDGKIILSLAAGISTSYIVRYLPKNTEVVRAMPNLACSVGEGMICITGSRGTSTLSIGKIKKLFELTGKVILIDEKYMDAVTGLSGSGPAFVYVFIEALADAGVRLGLQRETSFTLAAQTTLGAGKLVVSTGEHPAKLKDLVVTPGGTTIEGLIEIEKGGLRAIVIEAVSKAAEKAYQLQKGLKKYFDK